MVLARLVVVVQNPLKGCTDASACNYNADADTDDGSCTYPSAANLDCDGNCVNDADADGVCDENEMLGCTNDLPLATTTPLQQTTTALVPKNDALGCVVVLVRPTQMRMASAMTTHVCMDRWTIVACATVTTLLAPVVQTLLLATTKEPPLTMALVCLQTNVACVEDLALQTEHATVTATCSMSAACVAEFAIAVRIGCGCGCRRHLRRHR